MSQDVSPERESRIESYLPRGMIAKLEAARVGGSMDGERRIVTMLFCDVVGSTAMAEQLDHTGHGLPLQHPIAVASAVDRFLHAE